MAPIADLTIRLSAQIAEFQSEFREAAKSAQRFQSDFLGVATKASAIGNIIANGVSSAVRGLQSLAEQVLENASTIVDLSNKTGLAMSTIQQFQHVAEQTGSSVDAFTNAAFKLGTNLAGGGKSVVAAISALGLSFAEIRKLGPDEQFNRIASALSKMENPQERNRIALELFGKSAKDILPAIAEGYDKLAQAAVIAGDEQIKMLDAAGDAWAKFQRDAVSAATQFAGNIVLAGKAIKESGITAAFATISSNPIEGIQRLGTAYGAIQQSAKPAAAEVSALSGAFEAQVKALEKTAKAQEDVRKAQEAYRNSVRALADELSGSKLVADVRKLADAFGLLTAEQKKNPAVANRVADAAQNLQRQGAALTPELFQLTIQTGRFWDDLMRINPALDTAAEGFIHTSGGIEESVKAFKELADVLNDPKLRGIVGGDISTGGFSFGAPEPPKPLPPTWWQDFFGVGTTLKDATRFIAHDAVNNLARAITTGDWASFKASLADTFAKFAGAAIGAGVNALVPGLGTLLEPLFTAITGKLFSLFDRNRGRDLVEAFAESMGGFDALQAKLAELGAEGDRLWRQLTQGVGRNNPEQAQRAIDAVSAALGVQASRLANANSVLQEYGLTWEDTGQKFKNASIAEAFDAIFEKTQTLKLIGVDYNTILEKQADQYSELLRAALRTGAEIPESMRPILEDLLQMGKLVNENGEAFTSLEDVSWAKTMTAGFKDVTDAIHELTDALTRGVGGALDNLSRRRVNIPVGFDVGETAPGSRGVPVGSVAGLAGETTQNINVYLDNDVLVRGVVRGMPNELALNGVS